MKKSALAFALLGACASIGARAQTLSIGGLLVANVQSHKIGNTARATQQEMRVDDFISRFWLSGKEDLGGGLSAIFMIENRFSVDMPSPDATGSGLGNGDTYVGLKGDWGQVTVGKHSWMLVQGVPIEALGAKGLTAMPPSMWGTYTILSQAGGYLDISRRNNSVTYRTPTLGGFSGIVGISSSGGNGNEGSIDCTGAGTTAIGACATPVSAAAGNQGMYGDGREYFLQTQYFDNPLYMGLAYRNNKAEGRTGIDDAQWRLFGSYKFGGWKVGAAIDHAMRSTVTAGLTTTKVSRTAWMLPVSYVSGNHAFLFNYARAGNLGSTANSGAKMITLGWDYALSARTAVGVYYSKLSNESAGGYQSFLAGTTFNGSALAKGESVTAYSAGIKHSF